jgi:hypothetical protein
MRVVNCDHRHPFLIYPPFGLILSKWVGEELVRPGQIGYLDYQERAAVRGAPIMPTASLGTACVTWRTI